MISAPLWGIMTNRQKDLDLTSLQKADTFNTAACAHVRVHTHTHKLLSPVVANLGPEPNAGVEFEPLAFWPKAKCYQWNPTDTFSYSS